MAICEQMEDPAEAKKRGGKSVVRRDVVRLVTPGTLTEETLLEARRHNYLAAFAEVRGGSGRSPGSTSRPASCAVMPSPAVRLRGGAGAARPARGAAARRGSRGPIAASWSPSGGAALTPLAPARFDSTRPARRRLQALFGVAALDGFGGLRAGAEVAALGALVDYLELTQKGRLPLLRAAGATSAGGPCADRRRHPPQSGADAHARCRAGARARLVGASTAR